jgi:hypothetical protein
VIRSHSFLQVCFLIYIPRLTVSGMRLGDAVILFRGRFFSLYRWSIGKKYAPVKLISVLAGELQFPAASLTRT